MLQASSSALPTLTFSLSEKWIQLGTSPVMAASPFCPGVIRNCRQAVGEGAHQQHRHGLKLAVHDCRRYRGKGSQPP